VGGRLLPSVLIVAVLYANVTVIVRPVTWQLLGWEGPPIPAWAGDALHVFGVFWTYESINRDVQVEGFRTGDRPRWIRLDVRELMPFSRGERMSRLWADRRIGTFPQRTREQALAFQARRIRERWNRTHPEDHLSRIRIVEQTWPRSHEGYEAEKAGNVRRQVWYQD